MSLGASLQLISQSIGINNSQMDEYRNLIELQNVKNHLIATARKGQVSVTLGKQPFVDYDWIEAQLLLDDVTMADVEFADAFVYTF
jgi:hypothetical protein